MRTQQTKTLRESFRGRLFLLLILAVFSPATLAIAQTSSFTYQGRFTDGGTAATGTYDMQFKLFDTASAGSQIGSAITNGAVLVNNGVFTVQLDYGAAAFSGADRYLEIGVRLAGDANPYTVLAPRQQLTSAVYAIRAGSSTNADTATNASTATNATQLGGVAASQYVQTNDSRLADARTPTAGSSNYIQNTNSPQSADFNVSGNGTLGGVLSAGTVNAGTQYNLGGNRVLSVGGIANTIVGIDAGAVNTGALNSFFGSGAGKTNTSGHENSFFGNGAGSKNMTGASNTFFGNAAGRSNTTAHENSFFGGSAGTNNQTGRANSFFGQLAGVGNITGNNNSFFGSFAGVNNSGGSDNSFFGQFAGDRNESGSGLTIIGVSSDVSTTNLTNASAIGAYAQVSQSNSLVLGSINGVNNASADTNVGIGTTAPNAKFHIAANGGNIVMGNPGCSAGFAGIGFGSSLSNCTNYSLLGDGTHTLINRPTGGTLFFREGNTTHMSIAPGGEVYIKTFAPGGVDQLCRNPLNQISLCSSSLRYKTNIQPFISGLSVLNRLRPITFDWKQGGMHDLGFGAEDIAAIEPLLVTHNDKGEVEGVKYDRITAVLVNAVKEQQAQLKQQQQQIDSLRRLVAARHARVSARRR